MDGGGRKIGVSEPGGEMAFDHAVDARAEARSCGDLVHGQAPDRDNIEFEIIDDPTGSASASGREITGVVGLGAWHPERRTAEAKATGLATFTCAHIDDRSTSPG